MFYCFISKTKSKIDLLDELEHTRKTPLRCLCGDGWYHEGNTRMLDYH